MLAKLGDEPFDDDDWVFEIKWDGIRGLAFCEGGDYRLRGRSKSDLKPRYPELTFLADLEPGLLLDGELVVMKDGRPDFYLGMQRTHLKNPRSLDKLSQVSPADFVVFDILYRRGESVMDRPLRERTELLGEVLGALQHPRLVLSQGVVGKGIAMYEEARRRELEGVMAKRLDSRYRAGRRTESWVKLKPRTEMPCVILGYRVEGDDLCSLVIGAEEEGRLVCVGRVASGLTDRHRRDLMLELRARDTDAPIVDCGMQAQWVDPGLLAQLVQFALFVVDLRRDVVVRDPEEGVAGQAVVVAPDGVGGRWGSELPVDGGFAADSGEAAAVPVQESRR